MFVLVYAHARRAHAIISCSDGRVPTMCPYGPYNHKVIWRVLMTTRTHIGLWFFYIEEPMCIEELICPYRHKNPSRRT
jgi:hypothetical protein